MLILIDAKLWLRRARPEKIFVETRAQKPHGMGLELVYRADNRCESSRAQDGAFPGPHRGQVGQGSCPKSTISSPEIWFPDMISAGSW